MKEIIRKVVLSILAVIVVIAVVSNFLKSDDPVDVIQSTVATSAGDSSLQGVNPSSPAGSTDSTATTNISGTTSATQNGIPSDSQNPGSQSTTGVQGVDNSATQNVQSSQPQQGTTSSSGVIAPPGVQQPQKVNKIDRYLDIFRSGNFVMKVNDPDLGLVTMAMSGNKMFLEASMEGITLKMLYDGDKPDSDNPQNGTWYIIIDNIKKYSPMPADMIGDMNVEEMTKDFAKGDSNTVYTTTYETINGEQLECESCVDSNGNTTKYYFRGDQLVRSDSISPDGSVSTTEFMEISSTVDPNIFTIPAGYAKWDISWLMNMMG